ncbi:MAG: hypothetical protein AAGG48_10375 [Planctomycetota bacterium]
MSDKDGSKTRWSEMRDLFAATREAMIVTAVLLILLAPSVVRGSLQRAGITSFAGVEFEDVVDAGEQVALAEAQVAQLSNQLAGVERQLELLSNSGRSARPEEIRQLADTVHSIKTQATDANESLSKTTEAIDRTIQLMPPEKLRELAERNARRQAQQTVPTRLPSLESAELWGDGPLLRPSEVRGNGLTR